MKRYDGLFRLIVDIENLYVAYQNVRKRKHFKRDIMRGSLHIEKTLKEIQQTLIDGTWSPDSYHQFECRSEVKRRTINAPSFRDRIVHHAIIQVVMPLFEKKFIYHSYACRLKPKRCYWEPIFVFERKKKGTHRAVKQLQKYMRSIPNRGYVLQCDISKYYLTIDHEKLKREIRHTIADRELLRVWDRIIEGYHEPTNPVIEEIYSRDGKEVPSITGKGVPIGALTSQLSANIYLNQLDHFAKEKLHIKRYLRYMDDFIIIGETKEELYRYFDHIRPFVENNLKLVLNPKTKVFPASHGVDFAGYRTFRDHILPRKRNIKAAKIRFKDLSFRYRHGNANMEDITSRVESFLGYVKHCKSDTTVTSTLKHLVLTKGD